MPAGGATSIDDGVAAPELGNELALHELLADARGVGVFAVDLGDRHDDRHLGRTRVVDRFDRLRHHAVVGGDHEDRDVGRAGAACAHGGERLVTRRVDERDRVAVVGGLVRADVLRDPARFAGDDVRVADRVEQRGLAVVDVAHDGDDRRTRLLERVVVFVVVAEQRLQLELRFLAGLDEQHVGTERLGDELDHLVGERLRAGDHLARVEQQAHEVGRGAVQLGRELLDRDAALDDDLVFGNRRVTRGELRHRRRTEVFEVATTTLAPPRPLALRAGTPARGTTATRAAAATGAAASTTGAAGARTGTAAVEAAAATATADRRHRRRIAARSRHRRRRPIGARRMPPPVRGAPGEPGAMRGPGGGGMRRPPPGGGGIGRPVALVGGVAGTAGAGGRRRRCCRCGRGFRGRGPLDRCGRGRRARSQARVGDDAGRAHHAVRGLGGRGRLEVDLGGRCELDVVAVAVVVPVAAEAATGSMTGATTGSVAGSGCRLRGPSRPGRASRRRRLDDGLFDGRLATEPLGVGETTHAVGEGVVDAR